MTPAHTSFALSRLSCPVFVVLLCSGSDKRTRNLLPNGFYKFLVHNVKELELLLMHNR